ncbi:hypothetical protein [Pimelobacter simplex]|nr:hypothetical protein [Pimelobacter simplex]
MGVDLWLVVVASVIGLSSLAALGSASVRGLTRRPTVGLEPEPVTTSG